MKKLLCFLLMLCGHSIFGQHKATQIDQLLTMLYEQSQFNGNVLIIHEGKEVLKKSYGLANRTTMEPLNEHSVFELASLSKQFTAAGIILLNRQGKLAYSDKLTRYFPELQFAENVSIENLLNHYDNHRRIALAIKDEVLFIEVSNIVRLQADANYTKIYLKEGSNLLLSGNIGHFEKLLDDQRFYRPHQSHLVNLKYLKKYVRSEGGYFVMIDGSSVPISRLKREEVKRLFIK